METDLSADPSVSTGEGRGGGQSGKIRQPQESGFHGRRKELWEIERRFVGGTRRLVVHGFGGQGKTALAEEAGRWLGRTGMFARVCFVDYKAFQGVDAVGVAVATLGTVLDRSLIDAAAATAALKETPTLVILDNLEALERPLAAPLLAAAAEWSEAKDSRVLVTTRQADLEHGDWPIANSNRCRFLELKGLQPEDALAWFQALLKLPPEPRVKLPDREPLLALFERVGNHPLSVEILARVLKERRIAEVGERLEALLQSETDPLVASLTLSLERLDPATRGWLPKLSVFQGGAWEPMILAICEIAPAAWADLRRALEQTGLVRAESLGELGRYIAFHPTLAPALTGKLPEAARDALAARHRQGYDELSGFLYQLDDTNPAAARAVAARDLPNLLAAVHAALDAGAADAAAFAGKMGLFLGVFGLHRDRETLARRSQAAAGEPGSRGWYRARSHLGDQLFAANRYAEAAAVFADILRHLDPAPSFDRTTTLDRLARCHPFLGRPDTAETLLRQALAEGARLDQTDGVQRLFSTVETSLANVLIFRGDYREARTLSEKALETWRKRDDPRNIAVSLAQLGMVALFQGDLPGARKAYEEARVTFRALGEPASEATAWHQLGIVYQRARQWAAAEQAFRESARIREALGDRRGAAGSWDQLAQVMKATGRPEEAEAWYRKALQARQDEGDRSGAARTLGNLADLLQQRPDRRAEARTLAEQALALEKGMDPAAAEIWKTYAILADIAAQEGQAAAARDYRRQARETFAAAGHADETRRRFAPVIATVAAAVHDPAQRPAVDQRLTAMEANGWTDLVPALRRVLAGERDEAALLDPLDREDSVILQAVLRAVADPAYLRSLTEAPTPADA